MKAGEEGLFLTDKGIFTAEVFFDEGAKPP